MSNLALLNIFEVEHDGATRHLICFIEPVLATARGIDGRAVLGEFTPGPDGGFDPGTFQPNRQFIEAFVQFMNDEPGRSPDLTNEARKHPGGRLYIVDARHNAETRVDPPAIEIIGSFAVDPAGQIVPGSFQHNEQHAWFNPDTGGSSILVNRQFYDWLHRQAGASGA